MLLFTWKCITRSQQLTVPYHDSCFSPLCDGQFVLIDLTKIDQYLPVCFIAFTVLHVAYKTTRRPLKDECLDVLAITCLQSNDVRCRLNARHSSVLSLSQAAKLMKVVANNSRSTVQLTEIELFKACLYSVELCHCVHHDSDSVCYVVVLYYNTEHYTDSDRSLYIGDEVTIDHSCRDNLYQRLTTTLTAL